MQVFQVLIERFQAAGGEGGLSVLGCMLQKSVGKPNSSTNLKNYFIMEILYKASNSIL